MGTSLKSANWFTIDKSIVEESIMSDVVNCNSWTYNMLGVHSFNCPH